MQVDCFLSPLYPPPLDDQRGVESVLYAHLCSPPLSSPPSPCSLQCSRFVASIDLESCAAGTSESTPAHGLLTFMRDALAEVYTISLFVCVILSYVKCCPPNSAGGEFCDIYHVPCSKPNFGRSW